MIHEVSSSPSSKQKGAPSSYRKWKICKGRRRWDKEVSKKQIVSSQDTFLREKAGVYPADYLTRVDGVIPD